MNLFTRVMLRDEQGRFLVLHNIKRNRWEFPGGKLDRGEDPETAAVRETKEETGLKISKLAWQCARTLINDEGVQWVGDFYTAKWKGKPVMREDTKHKDMRWVTFDELLMLPQIPTVMTEPARALVVGRRTAFVERRVWDRDDDYLVVQFQVDEEGFDSGDEVEVTVRKVSGSSLRARSLSS